MFLDTNNSVFTHGEPRFAVFLSALFKTSASRFPMTAKSGGFFAVGLHHLSFFDIPERS
ncbi:MAG: hypothetical protein AAF911_14340 [Planctomycetota bacterium]